MAAHHQLVSKVIAISALKSKAQPKLDQAGIHGSVIAQLVVVYDMGNTRMAAALNRNTKN